MGHVTRDTGRAVIDIDTDTGQILVIQRWAYRWALSPGEKPWTYAEQERFHRLADRAVWAAWSNRARMGVSGKSDFAKRFAKRGAPVNMDVQWVKTGQHWTVFVKKMAPGVFHPSQVFWDKQRIELGSADHQAVTRTTKAGTRRQVTVAHEYGHAAGNTHVLKRGDEYPKNKGKGPQSPHVADEESLMNIGQQLRTRHFRTLVEELNKMIPDTTFRLSGLK